MKIKNLSIVKVIFGENVIKVIVKYKLWHLYFYTYHTHLSQSFFSTTS